MQIETDGLVIAEKTVGESDRLITILTRDYGVIKAFAPKARSIKSNKGSSTKLLSYSRFMIYKGHNANSVNDSCPINSFFDLTKNLEQLALAQYLCEISVLLAPEGESSEEFLRLILNALHFISKGSRPVLVIKAAVELRMLSLSGYMPDLVGCTFCGTYESEPMYFVNDKSCICCSHCIDKENLPTTEMSMGVLTAMRHIIYSDFEKIFSFSISGKALGIVAEVSENYLLKILNKKILTLDFFHVIYCSEEK